MILTNREPVLELYRKMNVCQEFNGTESKKIWALVETYNYLKHHIHFNYLIMKINFLFSNGFLCYLPDMLVAESNMNAKIETSHFVTHIQSVLACNVLFYSRSPQYR